MKIPHHFQRRPNEIAMTPMIDVVFLLLIFFVCTASFQIAEQILPSGLLSAAGTTAPVELEVEPELEQVLVKLTLRGGRIAWTVNARPCGDLAEVGRLLAAVAAIDAGLPVILDVAGNVPLGHVIDLYDVCRLVGFDRVQFAASVDV